MSRLRRWLSSLGRGERSALIGLVGAIFAATITAAATIFAAGLSTRAEAPGEAPSANDLATKAEQPDAFVSSHPGVIVQLHGVADGGISVDVVDVEAALRECSKGSLELMDEDGDGDFDLARFLSFEVVTNVEDAFIALQKAELRSAAAAVEFLHGVEISLDRKLIEGEIFESTIASASQGELLASAVEETRLVDLGSGSLCVAAVRRLPLR